MAYFDGVGDIGKFVQTEVAELWNGFSGWRDETVRLDKIAHPKKGDIDTSYFAPYFTQSATDRVRKTRSEDVDEFFSSAIRAILARIIKTEVLFRVFFRSTSPEEVAKSSDVEGFFRGSLNKLNYDISRHGGGLSWVAQVASGLVHPGKTVGWPHVKDNGDGTANITCELLDPLQCAHDFQERPWRFVQQFRVPSRGLAHRLAPFGLHPPARLANDPSKPVTLTRFLVEEPDEKGGNRVYQAILVDNELLDEPWLTQWKRSPVIVQTTNLGVRSYQSTLGVGDPVSSEYMRLHARAFFADAEQTTNQLRAAKSIQMDGVAIGIRPPILHYKEGGGLVFKPEEFVPAAHVSMDGEWGRNRVEPFHNDASVMAANAQLIESKERQQRYSFPDELRARVPTSGASGYLYASVTSDAENAMAPETLAVALFIDQVMAELLLQFHEAGDLKVDLDTSGKAQSTLFFQEFAPSQIPKSTVVRTELGPLLPKSDLEQAQIHQTATSGPNPLYDALTSREKARVEDPLEIQRRIEDLEIRSAPQFKILRLLKSLTNEMEGLEEEVTTARRNGDEKKAWDLGIEMRMLASDIAKIRLQTLGGGAAFQQQPAPPGIGPATSPTEMQGPARSPDVRGATGLSPAPGPLSVNGA